MLNAHHVLAISFSSHIYKQPLSIRSYSYMYYGEVSYKSISTVIIIIKVNFD